MKFFPLALILFLVGCGSSTSSIDSKELEEVATSDQLSEFLMPHLKDTDMMDIHISEPIYSLMEELLKEVLKIEKSSNKMISSATIEKIDMNFNSLQEKSGEMDDESNGVFHEYLMPMRERIDLTLSSSEGDFERNIRDLKSYIGSFYILFPKK